MNLLLPAVLLAYGTAAIAADAGHIPHAGAVTVDRLMAADTEPGNRLTLGRDFGETHHSLLADTNAGNLSEPSLAWEYQTHAQCGLEATPVTIDGVLYTTGNWGVTYALGAQTGAGRGVRSQASR